MHLPEDGLRDTTRICKNMLCPFLHSKMLPVSVSHQALTPSPDPCQCQGAWGGPWSFLLPCSRISKVLDQASPGVHYFLSKGPVRELSTLLVDFFFFFFNTSNLNVHSQD